MENTYLKIGNQIYKISDFDQFQSNDQELINTSASHGSDYRVPVDATVLCLSPSAVRSDFVKVASESGALSDKLQSLTGTVETLRIRIPNLLFTSTYKSYNKMSVGSRGETDR